MNLSPEEKIMKYTGLVYGLMFIFTSLLFFLFLPQVLFDTINLISAEIFPSLPAAADSGKFWLSMTVSMMAGLIHVTVMNRHGTEKGYV